MGSRLIRRGLIGPTRALAWFVSRDKQQPIDRETLPGGAGCGLQSIHDASQAFSRLSTRKNQPAAARNFLFAPFPFPRRGQPGRAGSPHKRLLKSFVEFGLAWILQDAWQFHST